MGSKYAQGTSVPVEQSINDIKKELARFGIERYGSTSEPERFSLFWMRDQLSYRVEVMRNTKNAADDRRRMRALLLTIKALLVAVDEKIMGFEDAFLSSVVMPGGQRVGEYVVPQLKGLPAGSSIALPFRSGK